MIVLDSNIWIGYLNENDTLHHQAVTLFATITRPVIIPEYVLIEVSNILIMKRNYASAAGWLTLTEENQEAEILPSNPDFLKNVMSFFCSEDWRGLSFIDISLLYLARDYTVLTFDKQLERAIKKLKSLPN